MVTDDILDFLFQTLPLPTAYRLRDERQRFRETVRGVLYREPAISKRVLMVQDAVPPKLFLLAEGKGKALRHDNFRRYPFAPYLYDAPAIMADLRGFYKQKKARFSIETTSHAVIYSISRPDIGSIEQAFPKLAAVFRLLIKAQNTYLRQYEEDCLRLPARERYAAAAEKHGALLDSFLHKDVAAHIGVAPETFSRMLKQPGRNGRS